MRNLSYRDDVCVKFHILCYLDSKTFLKLEDFIKSFQSKELFISSSYFVFQRGCYFSLLQFVSLTTADTTSTTANVTQMLQKERSLVWCFKYFGKLFNKKFKVWENFIDSKCSELLLKFKPSNRSSDNTATIL